MAGNAPDLTLFPSPDFEAPCLVEVLDICAPVPICIGREALCLAAFNCADHSCVPYRIPPPDPVPVPLPETGLMMLAALAAFVVWKRRV
ncbi:hypothetical protein [Roseicyclus sp.]|uniref:hypothetical protein n=1 Tax=Roseicyclus sp. TaxID=1914329 RepID=UPI003F6A80CC